MMTARRIAAVALGGFVLLSTAAGLAGCEGGQSTETLREFGEFQMVRGNYARAEEYYAEIVDRSPGAWRDQYALGVCLIELERYDDARRHLKIASDARPQDPDVADARAEAMYRAGDRERLDAFLRERTETENGVRDWLRLADYADRLGDPDTAQVAVETAIEIEDAPTKEPYVLAATLAENVGDLKLAERRLRQAHGLAPRDEQIVARLRRLGVIPGPTAVLAPGR